MQQISSQIFTSQIYSTWWIHIKQRPKATTNHVRTNQLRVSLPVWPAQQEADIAWSSMPCCCKFRVATHDKCGRSSPWGGGGRSNCRCNCAGSGRGSAGPPARLRSAPRGEGPPAGLTARRPQLLGARGGLDAASSAALPAIVPVRPALDTDKSFSMQPSGNSLARSFTFPEGRSMCTRPPTGSLIQSSSPRAPLHMD